MGGDKGKRKSGGGIETFDTTWASTSRVCPVRAKKKALKKRRGTPQGKAWSVLVFLQNPEKGSPLFGRGGNKEAKPRLGQE